MKLSEFDYKLPSELIAQRPVQHRDESRLMVLDRAEGTIEHRRFADVGEYLSPHDALVLNDTRVIPARLFGRKADTGAKVEALLVRPHNEGEWDALVKPARRMRAGTRLAFGGDTLPCTVVGRTDDGLVRLQFEGDVGEALDRVGAVPLPPYIRRPADDEDRKRYQCVYAKRPGAIAAPTAGLHFTDDLIASLRREGVAIVELTLHVGLGTFQPVTSDTVEAHRMHSEWAELSEEAVHRLAEARSAGGRIVAVGTTSVRTLESAAQSGALRPFAGETDLFVRPGHQFQATDALITNFHLPKSTLLMLVAAFAGYDFMRRAYDVAVARRYRFYSYGDAMLIR